MLQGWSQVLSKLLCCTSHVCMYGMKMSKQKFKLYMNLFATYARCQLLLQSEVMFRVHLMHLSDLCNGVCI